MHFKKKISKHLIIRLAMFIAVIGVATLFDIYFDNNVAEQEDIQSRSDENTSEPGKMYFVGQTNSTVNIKSSTQKTFNRRIEVKSHDKLVQKYHQLRNYQVFKAEVQIQTTPLILSYHYLAFKKYLYTVPEDDPLIS